MISILAETGAPGEVIIDDTWYSPGVVGFVATFGMGGAAVLLVFDLVRRVRRVRYKADITEKLNQELGPISTEQSSPLPKSKPERPAPPEKPKR